VKIVIAPNALKDSLSAQDAAKAMLLGAQRAVTDLTLLLCPVADGGDGFARVISDASKLEKIDCSVSGPLGKRIDSAIYFSSDRSLAVIEMATIAGLSLLSPQDRNPLLTTSYGVGEAITMALDRGIKRIMLGIGGSATNDAGIGMASALGVKFLNSSGATVKPIGSSLENIVAIDVSGIDKRLFDVKIDVACDVDNPFCGRNGAAHTFAAQKGASHKQVIQLDRGLQQFENIIKQSLKKDISAISGAGAGGGIGAALVAFCAATLSPGIDIVLDAINFNHTLENASLVLTAEGHLDNQTQYGKAPAGVAKIARAVNVPCIVLAGCIETKTIDINKTDFTAAFSICPGPMTLEASFERAFENLANTTEQVVRSFTAVS
jgi:glycerate kinase